MSGDICDYCGAASEMMIRDHCPDCDGGADAKPDLSTVSLCEVLDTLYAQKHTDGSRAVTHDLLIFNAIDTALTAAYKRKHDAQMSQ